jgi:hypothetical protein
VTDVEARLAVADPGLFQAYQVGWEQKMKTKDSSACILDRNAVVMLVISQQRGLLRCLVQVAQ